MSFTYNPNKRKRAKTHGFRKRMKTVAGRNVLKRRRARGRKRLCVWCCDLGNTQKKGRSTLRTHSDFQRVFNEGIRFFRDGLGFCVRKVRGIDFRYGISIPRRYGNAVERNRLRRRLREIIRMADPPLASAEIVFSLRKPCRDLSFSALKSTCEWAFARIDRARFLEGCNDAE